MKLLIAKTLLRFVCWLLPDDEFQRDIERVLRWQGEREKYPPHGYAPWK